MSDYVCTVGSGGKCTEFKNFEIFPGGGIKPVGYKTLKEFYKILKQQNKILKENGCRARFEIELPI